MNDFLSIAQKTVLEVRKILSEKSSDKFSLINSNNKDIKLSADLIAHNHILTALEKTKIPIFSEENNNIDKFELEDYQWIVDPLDGSFNYFRGFEMSAISISLWKDGAPVIGVIAPIFSEDIYFSSKGNGAWKNKNQIFVSETNNIDEAILATGFPSGRNYDKASLLKTVDNISKYKKIRMIGSAVMMLSMVASGVFDIYEEEDIYIWDVAAGLALINEAGGSFSLIESSSSVKFNVKASNQLLFDYN